MVTHFTILIALDIGNIGGLKLLGRAIKKSFRKQLILVNLLGQLGDNQKFLIPVTQKKNQAKSHKKKSYEIHWEK